MNRPQSPVTHSPIAVPARILVTVVIIQLLTTVAYAAPRIDAISLRGLKIGGATRVTLRGAELAADTEVLLPFSGVQQQVVGKTPGNTLQLDVTLQSHCPVGIFALRVANSRGVSNAIAMAVDPLDETLFSEQVSSLPIAMTGNLTGNATLRTTFAGRAGQQVTIDCESQRLGSKLRPVLRLLDERGTQIAWNSDLNWIADDARIQVTLPATGTYTVELHDKLYRGAAPGNFRIKIGALAYADAAFPFAVQRGDEQQLRLLSGAMPARPSIIARSDAGVGRITAGTVLPPPVITGSQPQVIVSEHAEVVEAGQADRQPVTEFPVGINGIIEAPGQVDSYLLDVVPGSKLRFDVLAARMGSPLDGILVLRNEKNGQLARNDDQPSTSDPSLEYAVPANLKRIVVSIQDLQGRGGSEFAYRIAVIPANTPDFALSLPAAQINIPAQGRQLLKVTAVRKGYQGPIHLQPRGLPGDVVVEGATIPAHETIGIMTLFSRQPCHALVSLAGEGDGGLRRFAESPADSWTALQPWVRGQFGFGAAEAIPLDVVLVSGSERSQPRGALVPLKLMLKHNNASAKTWRLRLVTNQLPQKKTVKEKNKNVQKDAPEKMLRLTGGIEFPADSTEVATQIDIPVDLPAKSWQAVVVADLVAADKKTIVGSVCSKPFPIETIVPFTLALTGKANIDGRAGSGAAGVFQGQVKRAAGYSQPITVTVDGLPKGYPAPQVVVPADQREFSLEARFPDAAKPAELKKLQLVATSQPNPKQPERLVRSNSIAVSIKVAASEPAAGDPAKAEASAAKETP